MLLFLWLELLRMKFRWMLSHTHTNKIVILLPRQVFARTRGRFYRSELRARSTRHHVWENTSIPACGRNNVFCNPGRTYHMPAAALPLWIFVMTLCWRNDLDLGSCVYCKVPLFWLQTVRSSSSDQSANSMSFNQFINHLSCSRLFSYWNVNCRGPMCRYKLRFKINVLPRDQGIKCHSVYTFIIISG